MSKPAILIPYAPDSTRFYYESVESAALGERVSERPIPPPGLGETPAHPAHLARKPLLHAVRQADLAISA